MNHQIHLQFTSKKDFLKSYPTLHYDVSGEWFIVTTPDAKVCALALVSFPHSENLLNRYQKHKLVKTKIELPFSLHCLLAGTPLQQQVWKALLEIPKGSVWSYQQLATHVKKPKAVRAIANAVGANPISPLIPCHRIIRNNGLIGGYYWGVEEKLKLLKEEGVNVAALKKTFI
ncbi:MAG: methylated-DNA--[protein]-cysteine S-methyltransferase [Proteobacteria bacterium]|nr:methylated-DNA--[protein]-cysteine S-methyltransferase [Pseudomonadota bacterium]